MIPVEKKKLKVEEKETYPEKCMWPETGQEKALILKLH